MNTAKVLRKSLYHISGCAPKDVQVTCYPDRMELDFPSTAVGGAQEEVVQSRHNVRFANFPKIRFCNLEPSPLSSPVQAVVLLQQVMAFQSALLLMLVALKRPMRTVC